MRLNKPPTAPDDVWAFAIRHHLAERVPAVLEMTRRVFPGCEPTLDLEADPEIPESYIVVNVLGVGLDVPQAVKARRTWCAELQRACPGPGAYLFRLRLEMAR